MNRGSGTWGPPDEAPPYAAIRTCRYAFGPRFTHQACTQHMRALRKLASNRLRAKATHLVSMTTLKMTCNSDSFGPSQDLSSPPEAQMVALPILTSARRTEAGPAAHAQVESLLPSRCDNHSGAIVFTYVLQAFNNNCHANSVPHQ